jgi:7-cyano-7-deazaguanine synthase in queuosine biosynthesis
MSRSAIVAHEPEGWSPGDPFFAVGPLRKIPTGARPVLADHSAAVLPRGVQAAVARPMEPVEEDLLNLAAGVAYADRASPRSQTRWERAIRLRLAARAPDLWERPRVKRSLATVLGELTGDLWVLDFAPRAGGLSSVGSSLHLDWCDHGAVVPYSGGLDSLATFHLLRAQESKPPLAVTLRGMSGILESILAGGSILESWTGVRLLLGAGKHAEATFRSRSFLFLALASVVARLRGVRRVVVPETGQGAVGAWLTQMGDEPHACGSHPYFTRRFQDFLCTLWSDEAPRIEHPNLWRTKAELLAAMLEVAGDRAELENAVAASRSCSYRLHVKGLPRIHCGICPNCLLRRVALVNGGFGSLHRAERYIWKDLHAQDLDGSVARDLPRFTVTRRHLEIARSAWIIHRDAAALADSPSNTFVREHAELLAQEVQIPLDAAESRLHRLLAQHRAEWSRFLEQETGRGSWLHALCE